MLAAKPLYLGSFGRLAMPRPVQFRLLPLPRSWPRRVRSACHLPRRSHPHH